MTRQVPEKFLVAFSLAGNQRDLVQAVAEQVERRLGESTVFYDEWYEYYIAGSDADLRLQKIYGEKCELAVICISSDYDTKPWTRLEHRAVRARYMRAAESQIDQLRVLAVRVGDGDVEGILDTDIAPDLRRKTTEAAAQLIVDRLNLVRPVEVDSEVEVGSWPQDAPVFQWPMADHTEAQTMFCQLLTDASSQRLLLIKGGSETGKTHLGMQMERNIAEQLPNVRLGRFDFKGASEREEEFEILRQSLGLSPVDGRDLQTKLHGILEQLQRSARPTVLIFDTYEHVGDVHTWMERVFLAELLRTQQLRVVVLGQSVPTRHTARWASIASPTITLQLPGPEDWWKYGRLQHPDEDITLDFVTNAHDLSRGKPSILAGLLGPR